MLVIRSTGVEDYLSGGETYIKALILGEPSAGKTRSASFFPKPIFADCEKGRMSIADRKVPYGEILSTKDMDKMLEILALECKKPILERKWQTFVVDTIDAYQRIVIQERLDAEKKEALTGWGDWGYLDAKMTQFIAKLHALPMNIVVNVHVKDSMVGDEDAKVLRTGAKLKGDLKDQIAAEFDLVGFMGTYWEAEKGERVLKRGIQWHPDPTKPILKDRSGQLPKWTPVNFDQGDFDNLFMTLISHLDTMAPSEVLETHETDPVITAAPQAPRAGGPVVQPTATPRKAAAPATKPEAQPESSQIAASVLASQPTTPVGNVTPSPKTVTNVPAAPRPTIGTPSVGATPAPVQEVQQAEPVAVVVPDLTQEMTPTEVAQALGGQVMPETPVADEVPTEVATTQPSEDQAEATVAPVESGIPEGVVYCGTGFEGAEPLATGCGKEIVTDKEGGDEPYLQVEIAQLKTQTNLCAACWGAYRAANKKGA